MESSFGVIFSKVKIQACPKQNSKIVNKANARIQNSYIVQSYQKLWHDKKKLLKRNQRPDYNLKKKIKGCGVDTRLV